MTILRRQQERDNDRRTAAALEKLDQDDYRVGLTALNPEQKEKRKLEDARLTKLIMEHHEDVTVVLEDPYERRYAQLLGYYAYWDPKKKGIHKYIKALMNKYDFAGLCKGLSDKYGFLPPGWKEELETLTATLGV